MVKEMLVGMAFAFGIAALFAALSAAGALLDTIDRLHARRRRRPAHAARQSSLLTQLYTMIGVLIFIAIGGDGWVIAGLARTYEAVPLLEAPQIGSLDGGRAARVQRHLRRRGPGLRARCCSR